jgi:hypothetical protein
VADDRGGSDHGRNYVTVAPALAPSQPPSGTLTVSPTDAAIRSLITVSFPATDPGKGQVAWDLSVGQKGGATQACCYTGSSTTVQMSSAGVYRIATQAIDIAVNLSTRPSVVARIGGTTGGPPIASATLDTSAAASR